MSSNYYTSGTSLGDYGPGSLSWQREKEQSYLNEQMRRQMEVVQRQMYEEAGFGLTPRQLYAKLPDTAGNYSSTPQNRKVLLLCGKI